MAVHRPQTDDGPPGPAMETARARGQELDEFTLERARRGDAKACQTLVHCYQRRVFAVVARVLSSRARQSWVEDLAQETFLRTFRSLHTFRSDGAAKLSTWILTIATRLAIDELRRKRPLLQTDPDKPGPVAVAPDAADDLLRRRRIAEAITAAVDELPADYRAAFVLREYEHLSYGEIADALQCDLGTVKSRISRARERLRTALAFLR